jgi:hypothetical protein
MLRNNRSSNIHVLSFIAVLLLFQFSSCDQTPNSAKINQESIQGTWLLRSMVGRKVESKSDDEMIIAAESNELVRRGYSMSFFADSKFTDIRGNGDYDFGKWTLDLDSKTITLDGNTNKTAFSYSSKFENKHLVIELVNEQTDEKLTFVRIGKPLKNFKEDQFYLANNKWRIKAKHTESEEELKERMANYIKHVAYILKSSEERKEGTISFTFTLGPVKILNGGIGIHIYRDISEEWKSVFLNDDQCFRAYQIYDKYLEKSVYNGASSGDWVRDDRLILESIYTDFKSKPIPQ